MSVVMLKYCGKCRRFKSRCAFAKERAAKDGLQRWCRGCHAERRDDPEYRAQHRERQARYYAKNPDKARESQARYARENPEVGRAANRRRYARKRNVPSVPYSEADIYAAYDYACVFCGAEATAIEHFIPIALGGPDVPENLLIACTSCNSSKGAKSPLVWLREARGITFDAVCVAA